MTAQLSLIEDAPVAAATDWVAAATQEGQLYLIDPEPPALAARRRSGGMASSDVGAAGESMFEGSCRAWKLPYYRAGVGQIGADYNVNGWRVQVKATGSIHRDGRMYFHAGSRKRFIDYAGTIDMFAFVFAGLARDYYGRSLVVPADIVFSHWRGRVVKIRPIEFPLIPNLSRLAVTRE